jgi:hypothetical protein
VSEIFAGSSSNRAFPDTPDRAGLETAQRSRFTA